MDGSSGQTSEQKRPTFLRTPTDCYVKGSEVIDSAIVEGRLAVSKKLNWQIRHERGDVFQLLLSAVFTIKFNVTEQ